MVRFSAPPLEEKPHIVAVKLNILVALLALALPAFATMPTRAGPLEDGVAAWERGDYAMAYRLFPPLAEQGNAKAQYELGFIYAIGRGVIQNHDLAVRWALSD